MSNHKTSLVLEGGGLRGAYTAGALTWLIDQGIEFDVSYGISTGAVYLVNFLMKNREELYDFSVNGITDKRIIGVRPFLRCGRIVDYDFLFETILPEEKGFDISALKDCREGYIGLYVLSEGKTVYFPTRDFSIKQLEASTSLPILGKIINYNGTELLDGGITDMIPIRKAVEDGCDRCLIITTKPGDYVRKPAKSGIVRLMKMTYPQCENISEDYRIRHLNYKDQIDLIKQMESDGKAVYVFPSRHSNVTRLGGSTEELDELFHLGYNDMENRKEDIFTLLDENS